MTGLRQGAFSAQLLFLLFYELGDIVQGQTESTVDSKNDGLKAGDYAAIGLGILLFVIAILIIVLCLCYKKGYIGKEPEKARVAVTPMMLGGFSTSPERLKAQTLRAIEMEQQKKSRRTKADKQPTFYIFDDIYHPPKSRPLPTDSPVQNGEPATHRSIPASKPHRTKMSQNGTHEKLKQKREKMLKEKQLQESRRSQKQHQKSQPRDHGDTSVCSSKTVSVNGHLVFPDNGRITFTTHYDKADPYKS